MLQQEEYRKVELSVRKIALFSSGVGYFALGGELGAKARIELPFDRKEMDDVLKSLTVYDPASRSPYISYPSEETVGRTLESLRVDLQGEPKLANILASLKGELVELAVPHPVTGRIVGLETRENVKEGAAFTEGVLTLFSEGRLLQIALREVESFKFSDPQIAEELGKALSFLAGANNGESRHLSLYLDGESERSVSVGYVIAVPVWKANYRLDLSGAEPFLQGWAIIDNASDTDWSEVELSLVVGRPVSFRQPYYAPYYTSRPELPLAIAGFAQAETYDSDYDDEDDEVVEPGGLSDISFDMMGGDFKAVRRQSCMSAPDLVEYETATGKAVGEHFAYTLPSSLSLPRRQSAMAPLVQGKCQARKVLIYNAERGNNPALGVELQNNLGMQLPAGAVTVFDGGIYAGDALLEFLPQTEKRLINYGDDLSVRGFRETESDPRVILSVQAANGVLTLQTKIVHHSEYILRNLAAEPKVLILEHRIRSDSVLVLPKEKPERTDVFYRFELELAPHSETKFSVQEETPRTIREHLSDQTNLLIYTNKEYPAHLRASMRRAGGLQSDVQKAEEEIATVRTKLHRQTEEQDRIRKNLQAVGADRAQGKTYLNRLETLDAQIAELLAATEKAETDYATAQQKIRDFLASLVLR
jgi:hypothetical protein